MFALYIRTTKRWFMYVNSCSSSQSRAPSPIFPCASLIFPVVSAARQALSRFLQRRSLSSLSCDGFGVLLEVFKVSMFTTNSKTTLNRGIMNMCLGTHVLLDHAHIVRTRVWTYVGYIHITREIPPLNSLVWGLAHTRPNYTSTLLF